MTNLRIAADHAMHRMARVAESMYRDVSFDAMIAIQDIADFDTIIDAEYDLVPWQELAGDTDDEDMEEDVVREAILHSAWSASCAPTDRAITELLQP